MCEFIIIKQVTIKANKVKQTRYAENVDGISEFQLDDRVDDFKEQKDIDWGCYNQ